MVRGVVDIGNGEEKKRGDISKIGSKVGKTKIERKRKRRAIWREGRK